MRHNTGRFLRVLHAKNLVFTCIFTFLGITAFAQAGHKIYVYDARNNKALTEATIIVDGISLIEGNPEGYLELSQSILNSFKFLVIYNEGYKPDTILSPLVPSKIYLKPISSTLKEVVITDKPVELLLKSGREYVVDYAILGENILVATLEKLFLLDNYGDTLMHTDIPITPKAIYKSCVGQYYLTTHNALYPIALDIDKKLLKLEKPKSRRTLDTLQTCILFNKDIFYYKFIDRKEFTVQFAYLKKGDSIGHRFNELTMEKARAASKDDQERIEDAIRKGNIQEARHIFSLKNMWDNVSFRKIDERLYICGDSLLVFDFGNRCMNYYSDYGDLLSKQTILFDTSNLARFKIIRDEAYGNFYLWSNKSAKNKLMRINRLTGSIEGAPIALEKANAENIQVYDDKIYYLWQDAGTTRKLYIQRNSIKK